MKDLKGLPLHTEEPRAEQRHRVAAREAYLRSFAPGLWRAPLGRAQAVMTPIVLAAFVGLYMMWAFASATALLH